MSKTEFRGPARGTLLTGGDVALARVKALVSRIRDSHGRDTARDEEELEVVAFLFVSCNATRASWAAKELRRVTRQSGVKQRPASILVSEANAADELDGRQRTYEVEHGDLTRVRRRGNRRWPRSAVG
jgi:type IV pilus biogenesis protein CpaD/CtpE